MKTCFKCDKKKPVNEFYKHKKSSDGHLNKCKECTKIDVKRNLDKVGSAYDFSEKGFFRVLYKTQKRHQKIRGHGDMPYTKDELESWCRKNGFKKLYDDWVASGYDTDKKPSADRLDDLKGYSFDNIRLVTWRDNRLSQHDDIRNGRGTGGARCKPLLKLDSEKNIVCEYVSYNSAQRDVGYSIEYQIKKGVKCRNGFYWKYK